MSAMSRSTHHSQVMMIIIDGDAARRARHQAVLEEHGFGHVLGLGPEEALPAALGAAPWALVLIDLALDQATARAQIARLRSACPQAVLVATSASAAGPGGEDVCSGVSEVLPHPLTEVALVAVVRRRFTQHLAGPAEVLPLPEPPPSPPYPSLMSLIATRPEAVFGLAPLVLVGEEGCEARQLAEEIHGHTGRTGRFAELTAAHADAKHLRQSLAECRLGTLFISELAALSVPAQELLLVVLLRQASTPARSTRLVIAHDPSLPLGAVRAELQRLLFLNRIVLPALRSVRSQIPLLIQRVLAELAQRHGWAIPPLPEALRGLIATYDFPGNMQELRRLITAAVQDSQGQELVLAPLHAALERVRNLPIEHATSTLLRGLEQLPSLRDIQRLLIEEALRRTRNRPSEAAAMLGISRQALHKRLQGSAFDRAVEREDTSGAGPQVSHHQ